MVPKHEAPYREFNVAAAVRDVSCVTCRACDVARDRSIGRDRSDGMDIRLRLRRSGRIFLLFSFSSAHASRVSRTLPCTFACFLHKSKGILTIPGGHGKDIDPLC